ncbi:SmtA protein [Salmonella enterica subsp. houtenae]|nr:SmtA protein [Salmonella enterica subsp. houtenae]
MQDRNFDDIAEKFSRNIYGTTKGQLRQAILWQDLDRVLEGFNGRKLRVLDAGGGEGQTAIKMAERGHQVTLCDLSGEMIARAQQAAEAKGVSKDMHFIQCPAQDVASHLESQVDLILFHAVLEWVADPVGVLEMLWSVLRPGGALSLMFYNANGLLMHNMVAGNFDYVQAGMPKRKKRTLSPDYPRDPAQVYQWLEAIGWQITGKPASVCFMIICVKSANSVTVMRHWSNWKRVIVARSRILVLGVIFMSPRLKARR